MLFGSASWEAHLRPFPPLLMQLFAEATNVLKEREAIREFLRFPCVYLVTIFRVSQTARLQSEERCDDPKHKHHFFQRSHRPVLHLLEIGIRDVCERNDAQWELVLLYQVKQLIEGAGEVIPHHDGRKLRLATVFTHLPRLPEEKVATVLQRGGYQSG